MASNPNEPSWYAELDALSYDEPTDSVGRLSERDFVKQAVEGNHPGGTPPHSLATAKEQLRVEQSRIGDSNQPSWYAELDALSADDSSSRDEGVGVGDYMKAVMGGGASLASGAGWALEKLGADTVGGYLRDAGKNASEYWGRGMTRAAQDELSKNLITQDDQGDYHIGDASWNTVGLSAAGSLLGTAAGMGTGAAFTKGLQLIPGMNGVVAGMLGYGAGEGAIAASSAGESVDTDIMGMTHEQLLKSPEYVAVLEEVDDPDKAKRIVADAASGVTAAKTFVGTAILSAPMGALIGKFTAGLPLATTRPRAIGTSTLGEATQEFGQSGLEQIVSNQAIRDYADPDRKTSEGVLNAAVSGAVAGGLMGGAFGASGRIDSNEQIEREKIIRSRVKEQGGDSLDADIAVASDKVENTPIGSEVTKAPIELDVADEPQNLGDLAAPGEIDAGIEIAPADSAETYLGDLPGPGGVGQIEPKKERAEPVQTIEQATPTVEQSEPSIAEPLEAIPAQAAEQEEPAAALEQVEPAPIAEKPEPDPIAEQESKPSTPFPSDFNANARFAAKTQEPVEPSPQPAELTANEKARIEMQNRERARKARKRVNADNDSITRAIAKLGGIKSDSKQDITRDTKNKFIPGVGHLFSDTTGTSPDDMASMLQQHGYITENDLADNDAYTLITEKINDELGGKKHYAIDSKAAQVQLDQAADAEYDSQVEAVKAEREAEYEALELKYGEGAGVQAREYDDWLENHSIETYDNEIAQHEKTITEREQGSAATTTSSNEQLREIAREADRNEEADNQPAKGDAEKLTLTQETEAQRADREKIERKAVSDAKKERAEEEAKVKREDDEKAVKQAVDESVDRFELGQDADDQLSGQKDIFNLPKKKAEQKKDVKPLQDIVISRKAKVKGTGQIVTLDESADVVWRRMEKRKNAIEALRRCVSG